MIRTEADTSGEWDSRGDWARLADRAVKAAVEASNHAALAASRTTFEISVRFAADDEVQALNAQYRKKDEPTNVLSFPMVEPDEALGDGAGEALLGDVVLAYGVCAREAAEKGIDMDVHAAHLIVHGTLHLLGHDHVAGEAEAEAMEETERRALAMIGIPDPYRAEEVQS